MAIKSGILNLENIRASSNAKKEIDKALILSFIGLIILLIGIIGVIKIDIGRVYLTTWLIASGFIIIVYSLIKVIISMVD